MLTKLLNKLEKNDFTTEEERIECYKELFEMAKLFDDLTTGKTIIYHGKFIAMNIKKYREYRDKQLVSAEAVAFTQHKNQEIEDLLKRYNIDSLERLEEILADYCKNCG